MAVYSKATALKNVEDRKEQRVNKDLLKSAVYSRGLTMTVMAEKAGIPYATLSRHLAENNMPLVNVKKIADTLGLSREELLAIFFAD